MLKNFAQLELKKNEKSYTFNIPVDGTWPEVHAVLWEMRDLVGAKLQELKDQEKPKEPEVKEVEAEPVN